MQKNSRFIQVARLAFVILFIASLAGPTRVSAQTGGGENPYFSTKTATLPNGMSVTAQIIHGPSEPIPGYEAQRAAVVSPESYTATSVNLTDVPTFDWVFGCSAVSGSMIAGYYDRNGYPNIYTGPTNGGVVPDTSATWGTWSDGSKTYPRNPLIASKNGLDGRSTKGSIDDYWVQYNSTANDPYITGGWTQHAWGTAVGDYMKTSQSAYGNTDGSTTFWNYSSAATKLTCADMASTAGGNPDLTNDGTLGRKQFFEARGYTVTDCFNQSTDNRVSGGFSFADYKAQIDAGHPIILNLNGHSIAGVGYDTSTNSAIIHDTWDYYDHTMVWGTNYDGMDLLSVSVVNLASSCAVPTAPVLSQPANGTNTTNTLPSFSWQAGSNTGMYQFELDNDSNFSSPVATTSTTGTSFTVSSALPNGLYYWHVRGQNTSSGCSNYGDWSTPWTITIQSSSNVPGAFGKGNPIQNATLVPTDVTLSWGTSVGATSYDYCYDTTNDGACTDWHTNGAATTKPVSLVAGTTYYWQVRANNGNGTTYADGGAMWQFTTRAPTDKYYLYAMFLQNPPTPFTGTVTNNGKAVGGITLTLYYSTDGGSNYNAYATTKTASNGTYAFNDTPEVGTNKSFFVEYYNSSKTAGYMLGFDCNTVTSTNLDYKCNMNIHDIALTSPANKAVISPVNVKFTWTRRSTTNDNYTWLLYDPYSDYYYSASNLGYVGSLTLTFRGFDTSYYKDWTILVSTPEGAGQAMYWRYVGFNSTYYSTIPGLNSSLIDQALHSQPFKALPGSQKWMSETLRSLRIK